MTTTLADSASQSSCIMQRHAIHAIVALVILGMSASAVPASEWRNGPGPGPNHERAAGVSASSAQGIADGGGGRLIFGLGLLREFIGNLARGGPGEGSTPHVSPTSDWKGHVNTNICNFKHVCQ